MRNERITELLNERIFDTVNEKKEKLFPRNTRPREKSPFGGGWGEDFLYLILARSYAGASLRLVSFSI
jgi:hypothetical protein